MLSLDLVNLEQDVCSQLFASAQCPIHGWKEREVQHWQGKWGLLSPNWCAKNILYLQKIMCSCSFGPSWHIYTVRQLSITAHAQVTTAWNSSVDVALQVGSAVVSDEPFGHCFSKAGFQHPVCGLLQHSGKKKKKICTAFSAAVSWGCQNEILNAVYYVCWHQQSIWQCMWVKTHKHKYSDSTLHISISLS